MIIQFGTVLLLGMLTANSHNFNPNYNYKCSFSNPNVITNQYLDYRTDDDDYLGLFSLGMSFDTYFNNDSTTYYCDNFVFDYKVIRQYTWGGTQVTYNESYSSDLSFYSYELENLVLTCTWQAYHEDDVIHVSVTNGASTLIDESFTIIPSGEEFVFDWGFSFDIDFSSVHEQILDYRLQYLGFEGGYASGYNTGYSDGASSGYQTGYTDGYTEGATQDETAVAIFSGIISVALIPINFFLACLNFEVFGINIGAFVSALLTVAIVVIITRMIVSGGNGGGDK